jgi:hypothetical protein
MNQGTIRLTREERGQRDRFRAHQVRLDGNVVTKIRRSQTIEMQAPAGTDTVQIAIDWAHSPSRHVEVRPDQTVEPQYVSLWQPGDADGAPPLRQRRRTPWLQFVTLGLLVTALAVSAAAGRTGALIIALLAVLPACVIGLWIYAKRRD